MIQLPLYLLTYSSTNFNCHQYHYMIWKDIIMYCIGIVILLIGVAVLVQQRVSATAPTNEVIRDSSSDSLLENDMDQSSEQGLSITTNGQQQPGDKDEEPSELVIT